MLEPANGDPEISLPQLQIIEFFGKGVLLLSAAKLSIQTPLYRQGRAAFSR